MFRTPPRIRSALPACAVALAIASLLVGAPRPGAAETWNQNGVAVLQGLDKVTARIFTFDAPLDQPVPFGTLRITARTCQKRPPEEPPESAAFLEISDEARGQDPVSVFSGWMFASSPALSALEHAVYDVWVIDCKNRSSAASSSSK